MTVRVEGDTVHLEGRCPVEDAEPLAAALDGGAREVEAAGAVQLHSAVVQTLLHYRPIMRGEPADPLLRDLVLPVLAGAREPMIKLGD